MSKKDKNKNNSSKKILIGIIILLCIAIVAGVIAYFMMNKNDDEKDDKTLAYTDLIKEISYGNVEKVEMTVGSTNVKIKIKNDEEEKSAIVPDTESFVSLIQEKVAERKRNRINTKTKRIFSSSSICIIFSSSNLNNGCIIYNDI